MKKTALSLAICVAMAIPSVTSALSLGEIQSNSSLNQPFRGKISLLSSNAAEARNLQVRVASSDVFNRVGIDRPDFLNSIRFNPTVENGKPVILVSSDQAIHEPFLNFLLEVSWPNGQLLKEYTVLLDPPILSRPDTAIASNTAGIRAEPRAQGRISRPAIQPARQVQQPRRVVRAAAPRPAPARRVAPPPSASVARANPVSSYRVRRGDTLSKVASKLGYNGVQTEQMMVALYQKNRRAFYKNNMNNLKAGVRLTRPSLQEARAQTARSAKSQIIAQARDWKKARATAVAKAVPKTGNKSAKGTKVASNQQARLEVSGNTRSSDQASTNGSAGGNKNSDLSKQLTMLTESLTTKKNENEELKSRVTELESLLRKKNRLITLKSEQLSTLQELVGSPQGETSADTSQQPAIRQTIVEDGTDLQTQVENNRANDNGQIIRVENEQNAVSMQNQKAAPVEETQLINQNVAEEVSSPFAEDVVTEESTDIMGLLSSPLAMGVGGGSLLALLGGLWFMRRRKNNEYEEYDYDSHINIDDAKPVTPSSEEIAPEAGVETQKFDESEFVESDEIRQEHIKNSGLLEDDQEDLLQEADVYIVYGLHDQAESELKQAIAKDPENLAYRAKLLENYKASGNKEAFTEEAKVFMNMEVEGKERYLDDISEWGSALIPESNLFSGNSLDVASTAAGAAGVAMVAGTAIAEDEIESEVEDDIVDDGLIDEIDGSSSYDITNDNISNEIDDELSGDDGLESFNLDEILADDTDEMLTGDVNENSNDDVDMDFNLNSFDIEDEDDLLDDISIDPLNIDTGNKPLEIGAQSLDEVEDELAEEFTGQVSDDLESNTDLTNNEFDFNFDDFDDSDTKLDDLEIDFNEVTSDFEETGSIDNNLGNDGNDGNDGDENDLNLTNLNLDLDADDFNKIMPDDHQYKSTSTNESVDGISDDEVEENLLAEFDDNLSFLDLDDDTDVIEETQIDTKLDLAKAYIDMGDIEGARSTLEEVLQEGSDEQKRIAEELLHQTG